MLGRLSLCLLVVLSTGSAAHARPQEDPQYAGVNRILTDQAAVLRDVALRAGEGSVSLIRAADRLERVATSLAEGSSIATARVRIRQILDDVLEARSGTERDDLRALDDVTDRLEQALRDLDRVQITDAAGRRDGQWRNDPDPDFWSERRRSNAHEARDRWRSARNRIRAHTPSFVGEFSDRWPYPETASYRTMPAVRYNRVEGLVLGVRRFPLEWDSYDRLRVYGQGGYAFSLDSWRYEIGGEARLGRPYREERVDLKVGVSYRRDTATDDAWKISWLENSLGAFFFRSDLLDYFETEGVTAFGTLRTSPFAQITVAYRAEDHASLGQNATWSFFGGDPFGSNPAIDEGSMRSVLVAVDGGRIRGYRAVPRGAAFRLEAELGSGLGGSFDFNRYIGDVHLYMRTGPAAGLAVRLRGGTSTGTLPRQKIFTLGGIGSVRAYPQNLFRGSRMLLANAEYTLYGQDLFDELFEDLSVFGLFDAGWTNGPGDRPFSMDDVVPAAGLGVGFGDRAARLELAFPLKDVGTGREPTLWLRLSPTL